MSLDKLLGTWDITMHHIAHTEPVTGRQHYERVLDGAFVMLRWTYDHPDFPDALALLEDGKYHYFDVRGVTRVFDLTIDDSGLSMERHDPDFWQRMDARFRGPDEVEFTGENSHNDGGTWEHDYTMVATRVD